MKQIHVDNLHVGPQALLALTRQLFWPLRGKSLVQSIVNKCITCFRARPKEISQLMGNLPLERVTPSRPFTNCGIDFCGPIWIHYKLRGKRPTKAYIAIFICMATKGVHLEVVSDLTTAAFIDALKRFIARRGVPSKIFSDNATNFMGARSQLTELHNLFSNKNHQEQVLQHCAHKGFQWLPIPPRSPYMGGIWEAAVKSAKTHLKKILHQHSLTFEQLTTVATEIEAVLNSRPLTPMSDDPNDIRALTPSSFWNITPLTMPTDTPTESSNMPLTTQMQLASAIQTELWKRWSREYLSELQTRYKWQFPTLNIKEGTLVLLKDDNLPPQQWRLARVIRTRTGADGLTRVVDLRTSTGETQRGINRICPLPLDETKESTDEIHDKSQSTVFCGLALGINELFPSRQESVVNQTKRSQKPLFSQKLKTTKLDVAEIDSSMGIGFEQALEMISNHRQSVTKPITKISWEIPAMLSPSAKLEPLDPEMCSELLKPTGIKEACNSKSSIIKDKLEAATSSKSCRSRIYSGKKGGVLGQPLTLLHICIKVAQKNIDKLRFTTTIAFNLLQPVLECASPKQLASIERHNPHVSSDRLWERHCNRYYNIAERKDQETWRQMYIRCQEETTRKLTLLSKNINHSRERIAASQRKTQLISPRCTLRNHRTHVADKKPASILTSNKAISTIKTKPKLASRFTKPKTKQRAPLMRKALRCMKAYSGCLF